MQNKHLNLIGDPWIPARTRSGVRKLIRPAEIVAGLDDDPIIEFDWPRADFRVAQAEFLIGLLTTACQPEDNDDWQEWWDQPPSLDTLSQRFSAYDFAFGLFDPTAPFLQDSGDLGTESQSVGALLIEQPGANTEKNNGDLFVKRGRIVALGASTAAIALYALQTFAPSGGAGHRTGLRGGGPLTTLAASGDRPSLWHRLWLNVLAATDFRSQGEAPLAAPERVFPWLAPLRTSEKDGRTTTHEDIDPLQCFWGTPRRIALIAEKNEDEHPCSVTGRIEPIIVRCYRTRPYGVNYTAATHPLTPYYQAKAGTEWLPVHPQPGGVAYQHWASFVQSSETRKPASCVTSAKYRLGGKRGLRLMIAGYDMDNMKARGFVEAEMPLFAASEAARPAQEDLCARMVETARQVAGLVVGQIKAAGSVDGEDLDLIRATFFAGTQSAFFEGLRNGLDMLEASGGDPLLVAPLAESWFTGTLRREALHLFDSHANVESLMPGADLKAIERIVKAKFYLQSTLWGGGKAGAALFKLIGMKQPDSAKRKGVHNG